MASNTITISLDEADRQRIDRLNTNLAALCERLAAAFGPGAVHGATAPAPAQKAAEAPKAEPRDEHPADAVPPHADPAPAPAPKPAEVTAEALMAKVRKLSAAGSPLRPKVKAVVTKYAPTVSAIKPEDRAACMNELVGLEQFQELEDPEGVFPF